MKSQLASPRAKESLSWGWDRAGSSKAAKQAAVCWTAKAQDQDIPWCQREKQLHNPCAEQNGPERATESSGAGSTVPIAIPSL